MGRIGDCRSQNFYTLIQKPSAKPYWKVRAKGDVREIFFMTTLNKTPGFIATIVSAAKAHQYPADDVGVYLQPAHQGVSCHCEFIVPVDRKNRAESRNVDALYQDASVVVQNQGAYFSRPYGIWADMAYTRDAKTVIAMKKVKDIFDPNHVMNPGKLRF
jgi:FAD/FMN-containing dehydrogenase